MGKGLAVSISSRLIACALASALLGACGNDKGEPSPLGAAVGTLAKATVSKVKARRAGGGAVQAAAPVTRADIEKYGIPILRVVIASRAADALVTITDDKGEVVTWSTTDGTSFSLRNGVLIQTRGLGPDLMSAQVPTVGMLTQAGGTHQRVYYFLGQEDQTTRRTYDCTVELKGRERIEIFARDHAVIHVTETCTRPQGNITNEFWIEGSSVRKSRQWASGLTGYIDFERVVD
jgi:Group 4 capsule polysaccharide lipoprotein gfcB, YjbF